MRRTWANRLLFAGVVAMILGVLVAALLPIVEIAIAVGLIAAAVAIDRVRWLPDPCLPPHRDGDPPVHLEVAATSNG